MRPRWLAALLVLASAPAWGQAGKLTAGQFLVASRNLGDPNFAETVILLIRYDEDEGTAGLIINRRTDVPLSRVFSELKSAKGRADTVYSGGPVEPGGVLALLKSARKPEDATRVFAGVYLIASKELLEKTMAAGVDASAFHAYLGYAGWGPGQLEHELELGAWQILPAEADTVFDADPDAVWARLIRKTELRIATRLRPLLAGPSTRW